MYAVWVAIILFEKALKNSGDIHLQTTPILFGFGLLASIIMVSNVFLPLITGRIDYLWLNPIFSSLFVVFIALILKPRYSLKKMDCDIENLPALRPNPSEW